MPSGRIDDFQFWLDNKLVAGYLDSEITKDTKRKSLTQKEAEKHAKKVISMLKLD